MAALSVDEEEESEREHDGENYGDDGQTRLEVGDEVAVCERRSRTLSRDIVIAVQGCQKEEEDVLIHRKKMLFLFFLEMFRFKIVLLQKQMRLC